MSSMVAFKLFLLLGHRLQYTLYSFIFPIYLYHYTFLVIFLGIVGVITLTSDDPILAIGSIGFFSKNLVPLLVTLKSF